MITFASDKYHIQIKSLWHNTFGDSYEYIDFYFRNRHKNENMLIYLINDKVTAMLTILPLQLCAGSDVYSARYIYAVATDLAYRGQGLSTKLLEYAHQWAKDNYVDACVLVPASKSLFDFYGKRGYISNFKVNNITISSNDIPPCPDESICKPCNLEQFSKIRNQAFSDSQLFAKWDEDALSYVLKSYNFYNQDVLYIKTKTGESCIVYERDGNSVNVKELALVSICVTDAVSILHKKINASEYKLRLRGDTLDNFSENFAMIHWLTEEPTICGKPPYISLVLD